MSFRESNMNAAVVEQLREIVGRSFEDMQEIVGGMDLLPQAFYGRSRAVVRFGAEVTRSSRTTTRSPSTTRRDRAGRVTGDYAICAIPFSVLREIEIPGRGFSRGKQKAIRELNYNASTKILLQVRHRFWEAEDGIVGGTTVTDLPIRRICYPSFSDPNDERGVMLASYTWGQDALRWGAWTRETMIEQAIEDVAKIHPSIMTEFEVGATHAWYNDPYARGAFALFEPEQQTRLQDDDHGAGGPDPLRRRAHVAVPRVDPGRARIGDSGGKGDPRGGLSTAGAQRGLGDPVPQRGWAGRLSADRSRKRRALPRSRTGGAVLCRRSVTCIAECRAFCSGICRVRFAQGKKSTVKLEKHQALDIIIQAFAAPVPREVPGPARRNRHDRNGPRVEARRGRLAAHPPGERPRRPTRVGCSVEGEVIPSKGLFLISEPK